jgi:hypothetical protein
MSALGQKLTFARSASMSVLCQKRTSRQTRALAFARWFQRGGDSDVTRSRQRWLTAGLVAVLVGGGYYAWTIGAATCRAATDRPAMQNVSYICMERFGSGELDSDRRSRRSSRSLVPCHWRFAMHWRGNRDTSSRREDHSRSQCPLRAALVSPFA